MVSVFPLFIASVIAVALRPASGSRTCFNESQSQGPCGPAYPLCGPGIVQPVFHIRDATCVENDPNGPFYDPHHDMYHLFWQAHVAIAPGRGPVWGHAASSDFLHWTYLPVALWNDQPYDAVAVYSGSVTIVNGVPVVLYPGLCTKEQWAQCDTGTVIASAVPADNTDPLYQVWTKSPQNPLVENTQRDPSTAWWVSDGSNAGKWRFTTFDAEIYESSDFISWRRVGASNFSRGECPSFFPRPPLTPGWNSGRNSTGAPMPPLPTHVHKFSVGGKDVYRPGTYVASDPEFPGGRFVPVAGVPFDSVVGDAGASYASKDFWDGRVGRRIVWAWGRTSGGVQTLPRDTTWHPLLQRLVFAPVLEQDRLRDRLVFAADNELPASGALVRVGGVDDATADADISVPLPLAGGRMHVTFVIALNASNAGHVASLMASLTVDVEGVVGGDLAVRGTVVTGSTTPVVYHDVLRMLPTDTAVTARILVDTGLTEVYLCGGRVALSLPTPQAPAVHSEWSIGARAVGATQIAADVWTVRPIAVPPETVLAHHQSRQAARP
eukprot:TRINITY_DN10701_c0_g1_i1.p1 TRINITY_DN10701_c0_g1~~TRINITY_DN10701_c0_g1_i1.p1  ORF type:complete len:551 (-),score=59.77 TRINITY_DN10701_c0_g1_i1:481-2133(-)